MSGPRSERQFFHHCGFIAVFCSCNCAWIGYGHETHVTFGSVFLLVVFTAQKISHSGKNSSRLHRLIFPNRGLFETVNIVLLKSGIRSTHK